MALAEAGSLAFLLQRAPEALALVDLLLCPQRRKQSQRPGEADVVSECPSLLSWVRRFPEGTIGVPCRESTCMRTDPLLVHGGGRATSLCLIWVFWDLDSAAATQVQNLVAETALHLNKPSPERQLPRAPFSATAKRLHSVFISAE